MHAYFGSCQFAGEDGGLFQGIDLSVGVDASFEAEAGIGVQTVAACAFADAGGVEVGTLEEDVYCGVVCTAAFAAKYAGNAHGFFCIADGEVLAGEFMIYAVECDKGCAFGQCFYDDLFAFYHVGIEAMQRLAIGHHDVVCDVDDVVDGAESDGAQFVLQPFGAFFYLATGQCDCSIARTKVGIVNADADGKCFVVYAEVVAVGTLEACFIAVLNEPCIEVAGYAIMAAGIGTVGCDVDFDEVVAFYVVVFCCGCAYNGIFRQYDDAVMVCADADFVFGAEHAEAFHATQFAAFDGEDFIAIIEFCAYNGGNYFLSGCYVGCAADNLQGFFLADIDSAYVHVVAVGVCFAGQHFCHPQAFQAAFDCLYFFYAANFEADAGQCFCNLLGAERRFDVFFKPFI